ncbi:MAG: hypothetical protein WCT14_05650 [Treponemataceae bacterium]
MNEERPLHELYERYLSGTISRTKLECALFTFVRDQPWRYKLGGWGDEERNDFIGDLYPTIRKAIDSYTDTGSCFDAYLYSVVRWSAIGFRFRATENVAMERAYWRTLSAETTCDPESDYEPDNEGGREKINKSVSKKRRQILALTLKCCLMVSDDFCRRIAPSLSMEPEELHNAINGLRTKIAGRMQRRRDLEEQAAAQYYRCVVLEAKAAAVPEGGARREKFERSASFARKRLENLRAEASRISIEATNREVASVMRVPKGTIDASLFFLRRRSAPLHDAPTSRV